MTGHLELLVVAHRATKKTQSSTVILSPSEETISALKSNLYKIRHWYSKGKYEKTFMLTIKIVIEPCILLGRL